MLTTLVAAISCALVAQAQSAGNATTTAPASQTSLPAGLDTCIIGCVTIAAAAANCSSYTDLPCVCTSTTFQSAATACLNANCTAADLAAAEQLQSSQCATLSASASTTTGTSTTSSSTTSTSATSTGSSGALALASPISFSTLIGTLVASAGALVGAALVF